MAETTETMGLTKPTVNDKVQDTIAAMAENFGIIDRLYPVGTIYQSTSSTDPGTFIGGTWQSLGGRVLVGAGTAYPAGTTGGSATSKALMPIGFDSGNMFGYYDADGDTPAYGSIVQVANTKMWTVAGSASSANQRIAYTKEFSTMPPYKAVYMWERVA